jgi:hypothetical protein
VLHDVPSNALNLMADCITKDFIGKALRLDLAKINPGGKVSKCQGVKDANLWNLVCITFDPGRQALEQLLLKVPMESTDCAMLLDAAGLRMSQARQSRAGMQPLCSGRAVSTPGRNTHHVACNYKDRLNMPSHVGAQTPTVHASLAPQASTAGLVACDAGSHHHPPAMLPVCSKGAIKDRKMTKASPRSVETHCHTNQDTAGMKGCGTRSVMDCSVFTDSAVIHCNPQAGAQSESLY